MTPAPPPKKRRVAWAEGPPGRYTNKKGYTLTRIANTKGWRLCGPGGEFIVTQLELFEGLPVVFDWTDQYINFLETKTKPRRQV